MTSERNVKVKLRDQTSTLRCPHTGWSIRGKEEKPTPARHSPRIRAWIASRALIVIEAEDAPVNKFRELLDEPTAGKNLEPLREFAAQINAAAGEEVIEIEDVKKADLVEAIQKWKDDVSKIEEGEKGDGGNTEKIPPEGATVGSDDGKGGAE